MGFFYSQLFVTPTYPTQSFTGKTVIVTGSNVGLGLEAARHFARLDAAKVILAVRNLNAGEEAKKDIETSTKRPGVCEVWHLDMASYSSVKSFASKAQSLSRLDVLLENAGVAPQSFSTAEDNETTITVNVVSTFLLALLLLPKLEETAQKFNTRPHLTIVSSDVHSWAKFPERASPDIFAALNDKEKADMGDRYQVSKLLELLVIREIASKMAQGKYKDVVLNTLTPGMCHSSLARDMPFFMAILKFFLARTTEVGGRTLVLAASGGPETHGMYFYDGKSSEEDVAPWVRAQEGKQVGAKVWAEVKAKLEAIEPGVTQNIE